MDEGADAAGAQTDPQEDIIVAKNREEALTLHESTHVEVHTDFSEFDEVQPGSDGAGDVAWMAHLADMQLVGRPIALLAERCIILFGTTGEIGRLWFEDEGFRLEGDLSVAVMQYDQVLHLLAYYGGLLGAYAERELGPSDGDEDDDDEDEG